MIGDLLSPMPYLNATLSACISLSGILPAYAGAENPAGHRVRIVLGDYRFSPPQTELKAGTPVILELENTDKLTPHNFTLKDSTGNFEIDTDIPAGTTGEILITPSIPGTYTFYCNKKLPFVKSHRDRGMEGTLTVVTH